MGCAWVGEDPCTNGDGLPRACCDVGNARPAEHRLCDVHVGHTGHQPCLPREETLAGERNAKETGFRWVQVEGGCERPVPANLLAWLKPVWAVPKTGHPRSRRARALPPSAELTSEQRALPSRRRQLSVFR